MLYFSSGLLNSLREEVKLWKANYQQQVEAAAAPSVEENDPESLKRALQDVVDAQAETLVWKEKAAEAAADEGLEGKSFKPSFFCISCVFLLDTTAAVLISSLQNEKGKSQLDGQFFAVGLLSWKIKIIFCLPLTKWREQFCSNVCISETLLVLSFACTCCRSPRGS